MIEQIQIRRDTAANWTSANPVLALGEPALETDTGNQKIGDGVTAWVSLAYELTANRLASTAAGQGDNLLAVLQSYAGSVARTQHQKNADMVSVLDFGADPTGTASSLAAFQAAIAATALYPPSGSPQSRKIYVPNGTYIGIQGITIGNELVTIEGESKYGVLIQGAGDMFSLTSTGSVLNLSKLTTKSVGGKTISVSGITAVPASVIRDVNFKDATYHVFNSGNINTGLNCLVAWEFRGCNFANATIVSRAYGCVNGLLEDHCYTTSNASGVQFLDNGSNNAIANSVIEFNDQAGITINTPGPQLLSGLKIDNVYFEGNGNVGVLASPILITGSGQIQGIGIEGCSSSTDGITTQALVSGHHYTVVSLGNTTATQWRTLGCTPATLNTVMPLVGQTFVATSSTTIPGTGTVSPCTIMCNAINAGPVSLKNNTGFSYIGSTLVPWGSAEYTPNFNVKPSISYARVVSPLAGGNATVPALTSVPLKVGEAHRITAYASTNGNGDLTDLSVQEWVVYCDGYGAAHAAQVADVHTMAVVITVTTSGNTYTVQNGGSLAFSYSAFIVVDKI